MSTVRLAAFGDLHLGRRMGPGVGWAREALIEATAIGADAIVFTGDLLDKKKATSQDLADAVDLFRLVTEELERPLVHVWGNHDVGSGMIPLFPEIRGVHRPTDDAVAEIRVPDLPLVFHAVNVTQDPDPRDVAKHLPRVEEPGHVGILHSEVEGRYTKNPCLPTTTEHLLSRGYEACLMGHVHSPVVLHEEPWIGWIGMGQMLEIEVAALP